VLRAAPLFGQHTREVLEEYGLTTAEIDVLIRSRAAIQGPV
jgi:crotonobetainyl-CoA:carnitine CoA-transferase CaiB-like acyl-CoA transferase